MLLFCSSKSKSKSLLFVLWNSNLYRAPPGVATPILGNPFCPSDTNPSLKLFFLMSIMRSRQIWLENFTFFNQILKLFFSNGGKLRDIEHQLCSIVLETFTLMHINGFLLLSLSILLYFCIENGYTSPFALLLQFLEWNVWKLLSLAFLWGWIFSLTDR